MEYYSAIKGMKLSFVEMWMDLDSVIGGKVNQKEKQVSHNGHF